MQRKKVVNPELKERLNDFEIPINDGVNYLIGLYFDHVASVFPVKLRKQVASTKIFSYKNKTIEWKVPLFVDVDMNNSSWINDEYRALFKDINKERAGPKRAVEERMLLFMANNLSYTKEDILDATRLYVQSLSSPEYIKSAHYFIYKGTGKSKTSMLEMWLERLEDVSVSTQKGNDNSIKE